jgi:hypothetical protein
MIVTVPLGGGGIDFLDDGFSLGFSSPASPPSLQAGPEVPAAWPVARQIQAKGSSSVENPSSRGSYPWRTPQSFSRRETSSTPAPRTVPRPAKRLRVDVVIERHHDATPGRLHKSTPGRLLMRKWWMKRLVALAIIYYAATRCATGRCAGASAASRRTQRRQLTGRRAAKRLCAASIAARRTLLL